MSWAEVTFMVARAEMVFYATWASFPTFCISYRSRSLLSCLGNLSCHLPSAIFRCLSTSIPFKIYYFICRRHKISFFLVLNFTSLYLTAEPSKGQNLDGHAWFGGVIKKAPVKRDSICREKLGLLGYCSAICSNQFINQPAHLWDGEWNDSRRGYSCRRTCKLQAESTTSQEQSVY